MPANEEAMKEMDQAAGQAANELLQNVEQWAARDVAEWWSKWYLKAGHKRLGRVLLSQAKKQQ
jgi:hypothetical protein